MPTKTFRQLVNAGGDWGDVPLGADGNPAVTVTFDQLNHGALAEIMHRVGAGNRILAAMRTDLLSILRSIQFATPPKPENPAAAKAKREADSRARAWAAYVKAGGTMPAEDEWVGGHDPDGEQGDLDYMPYVGNKVWRAMKKLGIDPTADDCMRRLAGFTAEAFGRCDGIGPVAVEKVRAALKARGLAFKAEE